MSKKKTYRNVWLGQIILCLVAVWSESFILRLPASSAGRPKLQPTPAWSRWSTGASGYLVTFSYVSVDVTQYIRIRIVHNFHYWAVLFKVCQISNYWVSESWTSGKNKKLQWVQSSDQSPGSAISLQNLLPKFRWNTGALAAGKNVAGILAPKARSKKCKMNSGHLVCLYSARIDSGFIVVRYIMYIT